MLKITDFGHRIVIYNWTRRVAVPMLEEEKFIDWDLVSDDDVRGLLVDFYMHFDAAEHLDQALFTEVDASYMAEALFKVAFRGNLEDMVNIHNMLYGAMFDALKTFVNDLAAILIESFIIYNHNSSNILKNSTTAIQKS